MNIASAIDHTILKPDCSIDDIKRICSEAITHQFAAVCVPPYFIKDAVRILDGENIKVATVIGFPLGYAAIAAKVEEIKRAMNDDIDELDVVINIAAVKSGHWNHVKNDIDSITIAAHLKGKIIKIIFETCLLTDDEIKKLCAICNEKGVDFVKTSTGFNGSGATEEMIRFLRENLSPKIKIKASGGIKTKKQAEALINAGADRLGTSSGPALV
jgi:deoxyribose-phosphate aldolase